MGKNSDELKRALNIHRDKLPIWIYRMRVLGYPPGWLQQAKVNTLAIFDGANEEGELKDTSEAHVQEYNKEALIEYPGFNTPVPEGVRDDWYMLGMPPMLPTQQLNEALKTMKVSEPVPYKRTKMDTSTSSKSPSTPSTSTPKRSEKSLNRNSSLEVSLNESSITQSEFSDGNGTTDSNNHLIPDESLNNCGFKSPSNPSDRSMNESTESDRKLKLISMGSPMPASETTKRPSLEKWAEGMGELLYFENPNTEYTGVYQNKMKGLIDKIRQKHSQT